MKTVRTLMLFVCVAMLTGCATSGRRVLFREYSATVPVNENSALKDVVICIQPFQSAFNVENQVPDRDFVDPPGYSYIKMTKEQEKQWDQEIAAMKKSGNEKDWPPIGNVRNGFGMVMSKVYAVNDPAKWLTQTLTMDLQSQGARVVGPSEADSADIVLHGVITFLKVDMYFAYTADLIVDTELTPRGREMIRRTIHTRAGQAAWSSSSFEYYQNFRQCQQKLSRILIADIETALKK